MRVRILGLNKKKMPVGVDSWDWGLEKCSDKYIIC
jgi:hypothetical protein